MGCGNSSVTNTSSTGGQADTSKEITEDSPPEDEKRKNYGGVYVGLPTEYSNMPPIHIGSTLKGTEQCAESFREPLWGEGLRS